MSVLASTKSRFWIFALIAAVGFLVAVNWSRVVHVEYISSIGEELEPTTKPEKATQKGLARPAGWLIIPGHNNDSYQWILQTQQMLAQHEWRIRHVDYDNAPFGRDAEETSPYRWWFGLVAEAGHFISGLPAVGAVERAALWVDPFLQGLFLVAGTFFVARRFGRWSAVFFSLGAVALFPFALGFIPGVPDDHGMAWIGAFLSVIPLLVGVQRCSQRGPESAAHSDAVAILATRRWFFAAGIFGGLALWVSVDIEAPILVGIVLGALMAGWIDRSRSGQKIPPRSLPWQTWSLGGAVAVIGAYLVEFAPGHLFTWQLRAIHPLYGLAWLGSGFLLNRIVEWWQSKTHPWTLKEISLYALALASMAAFPVVAWKTHNPAFTALDLLSSRLTKLYEDVSAQNTWQWLLHNGITLRTASVFFPVGLVVLSLLIAWRPTALRVQKISAALALGPILIALGYACTELSWWNVFDATTVLLVVAAGVDFDRQTANQYSLTGLKRWLGAGLTMALFLLSAAQIVPPAMGSADKSSPDGSELRGLIDRDLARWLARQKKEGGGIVLAPPDQTIALCYYGNLRGLGTLYWENLDGVGGSVRIASASTVEEAQALVERRELSFIVMPSWDTYLDDYARVGAGQVADTFIASLHHWQLPNWLRPIAYTLPTIPGFENQRVVILEVVEGQNEAALVAHSVEYFIDMGRLDLAASIGQELKKYPADLSANIARAEIALAANDETSLASSLKTILPRLTNGSDRFLAFDRRVALVTVLARTNQLTPARDQLQKALQKVDEDKLRALSIGALYRLQVLEKALEVKIEDPQLYQLARDLLPTDLRSRL